MEKRKSYTVGGNVNGCRPYRFLKKLKVELLYNPAIPFLGIYLEKMKTLIQKNTCTPVFIAVLFTIAKTWKQSS